MTLLCYNRNMRRVRITYEGASHHAINHGIIGEEIFSGDRNKGKETGKLTNKDEKEQTVKRERRK